MPDNGCYNTHLTIISLKGAPHTHTPKSKLSSQRGKDWHENSDGSKSRDLYRITVALSLHTAWLVDDHDNVRLRQFVHNSSFHRVIELTVIAWLVRNSCRAVDFLMFPGYHYQTLIFDLLKLEHKCMILKATIESFQHKKGSQKAFSLSPQ